VLVDREQHRAEYHRVIPVELVTEGGDELLPGACRVPLAPGRYGGACPV
jgi:hypothetical protein